MSQGAISPFTDAYGTHWLPLRDLAREFNKGVQTMREWCASGFILTLGYRTCRDPKGHWFVAPLYPHSVPLRPTAPPDPPSKSNSMQVSL